MNEAEFETERARIKAGYAELKKTGIPSLQNGDSYADVVAFTEKWKALLVAGDALWGRYYLPRMRELCTPIHDEDGEFVCWAVFDDLARAREEKAGRAGLILTKKEAHQALTEVDGKPAIKVWKVIVLDEYDAYCIKQWASNHISGSK